MLTIKGIILALFLTLFTFTSAFAEVKIEGNIPEKLAEGTYNPATFVADAQSKKIVVIDVRTLAEYVSGHFDFAGSIPLEDLEKELGNFRPEGKTYVFICAVGRRASMAYKMAKEKASADISKNAYFLDAALQYKVGGDIIIKVNSRK